MNPNPVTVRPVQSRADWRTLIEFPWNLYKGDPNWVPPLLSQRRMAFDRVKNPIWDYMDGEFFIAWRGDRPVGTIGAAINHRHNDYHSEKMAFFGHFEVYDDETAAFTLLAAATDWAREQGMETLRGPLNLTVNDSVGCLVEGFDSPPMILMPHNPPYYGPFIEAAAFDKAMDLWAWRSSVEGVTQSRTYDRMIRVMDKLKERRGVTVRTADTRRIRDEIRLMQAIYQKSWSHNWGFVPPTEREIDTIVEELVPFYDTRLGYFAEKDGKVIGFILPLPDFNQVLHHAYPRPGVPEWVTLIKAGWHWKIRPKITQVRVILLGVLPEYQGLGIDRMLMGSAYQATVAAGYKGGEASWILEVNDAMNQGLEATGFTIAKTYRIYEKPV